MHTFPTQHCHPQPWIREMGTHHTSAILQKSYKIKQHPDVIYEFIIPLCYSLRSETMHIWGTFISFHSINKWPFSKHNLYKKAHIVTSPVIFKSTSAISDCAGYVFVFSLSQEAPDCVRIPLEVSSAGIGALRLPLPLCVPHTLILECMSKGLH